MKKIPAALLLLLSISCTHDKYPHIIIDTSLGKIEAEIYTDSAPLTSTAFLLNVQKEIYDNSSFYRVLKADPLPNDYNTGIIQGGIYNVRKFIRVDSIPLETTHKTGLSHTSGMLSMARTTPGSAATEFFICIGDQSPLDSGRSGTSDGLGMAVFGKVISGMDVVRKIHNKPCNGDAISYPVKIDRIRER